MSTPDLQLQTAFMLNSEGRITSTREPEPSPGPLFCLVRGTASCAWAVRADVPQRLADELDSLAREESPALDIRDAPAYAERYISVVGGRAESGPAFTFPDTIAQPTDIVSVEGMQLPTHNLERLLNHSFRGWTAREIPGRLPMLAMVDDGHIVSICFCARRSDVAAEAGLETAVAFRGRGFGPRVTAAWALAIRASGRIPLYSTSWSNNASLVVARKLGLVAYACTWSLSG
jgi:hypothetical protein